MSMQKYLKIFSNLRGTNLLQFDIRKAFDNRQLIVLLLVILNSAVIKHMST